MLVAAAATSLYLVLGYPYGPVFGFLVLTVYMVARRAPLGGAAAWCVLALALLAVSASIAVFYHLRVRERELQDLQ